MAALLNETVAEDELPKNETLEEHDRKHHDGHFDPSKGTCKFRDKLATETEADKADIEDPNAAPDGKKSEENNTKLTLEDQEFTRLISERDALVKRNDEIPEENKLDSDKAKKGKITWNEYLEKIKARKSESEQNQLKFNKLDKKIVKMFRHAAAKAMPNTKVVGKDGLPLIVYHGTVRPRKDSFSEFADRPIFTFRQEGLASQYTHARRDMWVSPNRTGRVIPMVMNLENPYVVDAKRHLWTNIDVDWSDNPVDTNAICQHAKENGFDGVIIRQVRDNMFDNDRSAGDEYIAFSSNQVKDCGGLYATEEGKGLSHDYEVLVSDVGNTKDAEGNAVPLSKRFDKEKKDIRFSKRLHDDIMPKEKRHLESVASKVKGFIKGVKVRIRETDFADAQLGMSVDDEPTNPHVRNFLNDEGVVVGTYNRKTNEVTLYPGADADTIGHELCGHATWQYAEQEAQKGNGTLLKKMNEVVDAPEAKPVWDEVAANYDGEDREVQREEVWAHVIGHKTSKAIEEIKKEEKGKKWYQRFWGVVKDAWKGLMSVAGLNKVKTEGIDKMSPDEFSDFMVKQMTEGRTLGKVDKGEDSGERKSVSKIYTGSAANYDKPSLHAVGTGEGTQVYGWGLYGSTERGVAEGYARQGRNLNVAAGDAEYELDGKSLDRKNDVVDSALTYLASERMNTQKAIEEVNRAIDGFKKQLEDTNERLEWDKNNFRLQLDAESLPIRISHLNEVKGFIERDGGKIRQVLPSENIYEQTFFTDRAPGDESHLLKWYEPVTKEQMDWIESRLKAEGIGNVNMPFLKGELPNPDNPSGGPANAKIKNGGTVYYHLANKLGSPQAASEFLARAGIDGVKYPVDSYGGKSVKDGDKVGWNYVSFRDDNIRIDKKYVDGEKIYDYQDQMAKYPNIDAIEVLSRLTKLNNREEMAAEFNRIMEGESSI